MTSIKLLERVASARGTQSKASLLATGLNDANLMAYLRLAWEVGGSFVQPTVQIEDLPLTSQVDDDTYFREIVELARALRSKPQDTSKLRIDDLMRRGSARQAVWLQRLLARNLELGVTQRTMAPYIKGGAPQRFRIRRSRPVEDHVQFRDWIEESDYEGWRVLFKIEDGRCEAYSSSGTVIGSYQDSSVEIVGGYGLLARDFYWMSRGSEFVFDTKVVGSSSRDNPAQARAVVYDLFPSSFWQQDFHVSWRERRRVLNKVFGLKDIPFLDHGMVGQWGSLISEARVPPNISLVEFSVVRDLDMARDVASSKTASGQEGISIKDPDAGYTLGDDGTWLELKGEVEEEFKVVDVVWKVKQPMLKVVLDDTTVVLVGNLDEVEQTNVWTPPPSMRLVKDVHGKWRNPDGSKPDAHLLSKGSPNPEVIGRWARVRYHHRTKYGSLANPRFAGFRNESGGVS